MLAAVLPLLRYAPRVGGRPSLHRSSLHRAVCSSADGGSFAELGVSEPLLAGLQGLGFEAPTEIQRQAWPFVRGGGDVVLLDETGSGKTIAYALPVLQAMLEEREELVAEARRARGEEGGGEEGRLVLPRVPSQALLLAPNRELVVQVHATVRALLAGLPPSLQLRSSALTEDRGVSAPRRGCRARVPRRAGCVPRRTPTARRTSSAPPPPSPCARGAARGAGGCVGRGE